VQVIIYNGDPHRVRQDAHPAGDFVPTQQSGWRNLLPVHPAANLFPLINEEESREKQSVARRHSTTLS
jgi:hypothetical protein